jgi:hypothetical protein
MLAERNRSSRAVAIFVEACAALLLLLLVPARAPAVPTISIEPSLITVAAMEVFDLQIAVDAEADTFSNFDVVVRFDPGRIELVTVLEGSLYVNSGHSTWFVFEEESTGVWEVFDVIFPAGSFLVAPGELARLRLRALADGCSSIEFLSAALKDIDRLPIEPLATRGGLVRIGNFSAVPEAEGASGRFALGFPYPNPTRGSIRIEATVPRGAFVEPPPVGVFDLAGRLIGEARIAARGDPLVYFWDGRERAGVHASPGVYFARSIGGPSSVSRRIVIVR